MKDTRGEVIDHDFTERTTFVITPDYKIAATFSTADLLHLRAFFG